MGPSAFFHLWRYEFVEVITLRAARTQSQRICGPSDSVVPLGGSDEGVAHVPAEARSVAHTLFDQDGDEATILSRSITRPVQVALTACHNRLQRRPGLRRQSEPGFSGAGVPLPANLRGRSLVSSREQPVRATMHLNKSEQEEIAASRLREVLDSAADRRSAREDSVRGSSGARSWFHPDRRLHGGRQLHRAGGARVIRAWHKAVE